MRPLLSQVAVIILASVGLAFVPERVWPQGTHSLTAVAPDGTYTFAPSNARTEDGKLIPAEQSVARIFVIDRVEQIPTAN